MKQTQSQAVEVAYLMNGELVSVRRLSKRAEWRSALSTFSVVAAMTAATAAVVAGALLIAHRVLFLPTYLGLWLVVGLTAAMVAAARAARRSRSYNVGAAIEDDAFAAMSMRLVRREGTAYRLVLAPGFTGRLDGATRNVSRSEAIRPRGQFFGRNDLSIDHAGRHAGAVGR